MLRFDSCQQVLLEYLIAVWISRTSRQKFINLTNFDGQGAHEVRGKPILSVIWTPNLRNDIL
jgi:hypothetical protein